MGTSARGASGWRCHRLLGWGTPRFRTGGRGGHVDTVVFGAYRKAVLEEIGGLDEALVRNQDDELTIG